MLRCVLALALVTCGGVPGFAQHLPSPTSPLARREHPRIFLTRGNLPAIRVKLQGPMRGRYQAFVSHLDRLIGSDDDGQYHAMNYAFLHRVGPVPGIAFGNPPTAYLSRAKQALQSTKSLFTLAVAYDWLFDDLTPYERSEVAARLAGATSPKSDSNPLDDGEILSRSAYVLAGLAMWGDGVEDAAASRRVNAFQGLIADSALALHNTIAADDGGWSQGMDYAAHGPRGNIMALFHVLEGWRTANGLTKEEVFGGDRATVLRYHPQWVAYSIFPDSVPADNTPDRRAYRQFKTHYMPAGMWIFRHAAQAAVLNGLRHLSDVDFPMASLAQWLSDNRVGDTAASGTDGTREALFAQFLFGAEVPPQSPSQLGLPLTKKFDGMGWVVMRTAWDDPGATMVTFTASPWSRALGAYTNRNQGSFTINRNGPLVIHAGDAVHHGFANTTWSTNTMIFPDPTDSKIDTERYQDLGGQRNHGNPELREPAQLVPGSAFDIGGIKRFQAADADVSANVDYIFADLTRAYSSTAFKDRYNDAKLENFTRQFVYFRRTHAVASDFVVVFDRTRTTAARFEKRWILHTSGEPTIDGVESIEGPGRRRHDQARLITQENASHGSSGKLFVSSLLPLERKIVKVGGAPAGRSPFGEEGFAFVDPYGRQEASTKNTDRADRHQYIGTHRVEVVATGGRLDDNFLHVLEATDAGVAAPSPVALLRGEGAVGARFDGRMVVFSQTEGLIQSQQITVDRAGTYMLLVCDLEPGRRYSIGGQDAGAASAAGILSTTVSVPNDDFALTIKVTGG